MRTAVSVVIIIAAAWFGFFMGSGMNDPMGGAAVFAMVAGFGCTIHAIEHHNKS